MNLIMNRLLSVVVGLGIVVVFILALSVRSYLISPVAGVTEPVLYKVEVGASLSGVAYELHELGILPRARVFVAWGRFTGQAAQLKAGEYELQPGITPKGILDQFVAGQIKLYPFTILEGWTLTELRAALLANPAITPTLQALAPEAQLGALNLSGQNLEGQFFPETYLVPRDTTDLVLLQQAAALMQKQLAQAWENRAVGLPLASPYELLILASIVERETALDSERSEVAGVFIRRLQKGMRLQTDPTVIYGLGAAYDGNLTRKHLLTDTPYNTYTRGGLPPTPIGMPGAASLLAAAHPDEGDTLYFVATGENDGSHVFSRTLEEHNAAVAVYIARLRKARREAEKSGAVKNE
ncbi:MAG: endolytic transglycosylase MltG [Gammaproteobacteria bacterium]|nr:endolytic transglycosylase MltG [Gammaproteobacteria bacterium]MCP4927940.1 endolytic transglycosylase MltG [Gammaproteobacteria bacterium]